MKNVLIVASVPSMIASFNMMNIDVLQQEGCTVHVACNFLDASIASLKKNEQTEKRLSDIGVICHQVPFSRNMPRLDAHIQAYRALRKLIRENDFAFLHCHTPIAGVLARMAAHSEGLPAMYTAHGFHFYRGGPFVSWLLFYPVEKHFSRMTELLVTINQGDYALAKEKFHAGKAYYIPSIGIDIGKFANGTEEYRALDREKWGFTQDDFLLVSVGELNKRKNHQIILRALQGIGNPKIRLILCGTGAEEGNLRALAQKCSVEEQVTFAGYREDIPRILQMCDAFAFPSRREGLGMAALEAMAAGLPILTSTSQGIVDYSINRVTGYVFEWNDADGLRRGIRRLAEDAQKCHEMGAHNRGAVGRFDISNTRRITEAIYQDMFCRVNR